jgi:hypothetical protein
MMKMIWRHAALLTSCCVYVCDPPAVFRLRSDGQQKKKIDSEDECEYHYNINLIIITSLLRFC